MNTTVVYVWTTVFRESNECGSGFTKLDIHSLDGMHMCILRCVYIILNYKKYKYSNTLYIYISHYPG
jgi:hypothetical protein